MKVTVMPIVVGQFGMISESLVKTFEKMEI